MRHVSGPVVFHSARVSAVANGGGGGGGVPATAAAVAIADGADGGES